MIEFILLLVIAVLSGLIGWMDYSNRKERGEMLNAIIAKDHDELMGLKLADKTKIETKPSQPVEDLAEIADLEDKEYDKFVLNKGEDEI